MRCQKHQKAAAETRTRTLRQGHAHRDKNRYVEALSGQKAVTAPARPGAESWKIYPGPLARLAQHHTLHQTQAAAEVQWSLPLTKSTLEKESSGVSWEARLMCGLGRSGKPLDWVQVLIQPLTGGATWGKLLHLCEPQFNVRLMGITMALISGAV